MSRAVLLGLVVAGCDGTSGMPETETLSMADVVPQILVQSYGPGLGISARFETPTGNTLPPGARMTATFRGELIEVIRLDSVDSYKGPSSTSFSVHVYGVPSEEPVEVALILGEHVATSMVIVPAWFGIDAVTGSLYSSATIDASWSPTSTDPMVWDALAQGASNHSCSVSGGATVPDTGALTVETANIRISSMGFPCNVRLNLYRSRRGTIAADFVIGGSIRAEQVRQFWPFQ